MVNPLQCMLVDEVCTVLGTLTVVCTAHGVLNIVLKDFSYHSRITLVAAEAIEEVGIVEVCLVLTDISIKLVYASLVGSAL